MTWQILTADVLAGLATLPDASVQTVITSPPYWGLRDYGTATWEGGDAACDHIGEPLVSTASGLRNDGREHVGPYEGEKARTAGMPYRDRCGKCNAVRIDSQLGLEPTPEAYVERMVAVFREVRRVLRKDGTAWVNMGDGYNNTNQGAGYPRGGGRHGNGRNVPGLDSPRPLVRDLKPKDLVGMPWRLAFALQADGWYLRSDIIWSKPNPMPESVTDRPTKAHEYVFLLTRSARYFYDADAVREPNHLSRPATDDGYRVPWQERPNNGATDGKGLGGYRFGSVEAGRNLRSVWSIPTEPFPQAHFATFPKALVVPCVKAGTSEKGCCAECGAAFVRVTENTPMVVREGPGRQGLRDASTSATSRTAITGTMLEPATSTTTGWVPGCTHHESGPVPCTVLDPFAGSGTVGVVALRHGRSFVGIELNPTYAEMARDRIRNDAPLWNHAAEVV